MATITTVETTDNLNQGRWKINTNFSNLNTELGEKADSTDIPDNTDYVDLTTDQTVAWDKTFSWIFKKTEAEYSITATSWNIALDYNNWTYQEVTLTWDTTFTLSNPNRNFLTIKITDWWAQTITRPTVKWAWWEVPELSESWTDIVSFYYDGEDYYGDYQVWFETV